MIDAQKLLAKMGQIETRLIGTMDLDEETPANAGVFTLWLQIDF